MGYSMGYSIGCSYLTTRAFTQVISLCDLTNYIDKADSIHYWGKGSIVKYWRGAQQLGLVGSTAVKYCVGGNC